MSVATTWHREPGAHSRTCACAASWAWPPSPTMRTPCGKNLNVCTASSANQGKLFCRRREVLGNLHGHVARLSHSPHVRNDHGAGGNPYFWRKKLLTIKTPIIMLKTQYAGLELKNPIIAASSGLTDSVEKIIALEKAGVGAGVLKSLFEEQLAAQSEHLLNSSDSDYPEAYDYLQHIVKAHEVEKYLTLIREARKAVSIPVIASINCYDDGSWEAFAADLEKAGASAHRTEHTENQPHDRIPPRHHRQAPRRDIAKGQGTVHIPVTVKISRKPLQPGIGCRPVCVLPEPPVSYSSTVRGNPTSTFIPVAL